MTLTMTELQDMVIMTMIKYLRDTEGTCALEVERLCALTKWVEAEDFETRLEVIRDEW